MSDLTLVAAVAIFIATYAVVAIGKIARSIASIGPVRRCSAAA